MRKLYRQFRALKTTVFRLPLLVVFILGVAKPTDSAEFRTYTVIGRNDCKHWTTDRQKAVSGTGAEVLSDLWERGWLLGYLSALNVSSLSKDKDYLAALDGDTIFLWVDRYCTQNPNKNLGDAAAELFSEMKKITK